MAEGPSNRLTPELAAQLAENWQRLSDVYTEHLVVFQGEVSLSNWRPGALACLSRGHAAQQAVFALRDRPFDAAVVARVAFEHLVTFAWLMIDPEGNHPRFLRYAHEQNRKLLDDLDKQAGQTVVPGGAAALADLEKHCAAASLPPVPEMAQLADDHWRANLPAHAWQFRLLYTTVYRPYSSYIHPNLFGLYPLIHPGVNGFRIGSPPHGVPPGEMFAHSASLLSSVLVIASKVLGWPDHEAVRSALMYGIETVNGEPRLKERRDG